MGRTGLTDKQLIKLQELDKRKKDPMAKALTANMEAELKDLSYRHANPDLSDTCKTHLKEFYAGDREEIQSKYLDKGNAVEDDNIDFAAEVLGYGMADKNMVTLSDEFMVGTCDIEFPDCIVDVKSPWNNKTLLDNIYEMDSNYEWQLRGYMHLYRKPKAILFYGLQNTPETDYYPEISFDHIPKEKRWIAYSIERDETLEKMIVTSVLACREWLAEYDKLVNSRIGRINP